ncbi:macro domain-containing protein [Streptomyces sp. NBC_00190]|uniref:macro domain-containing protein n=1 Tax=Streptomyces sp. NBC_00190 TaxID=2903634 RepID=UPI002E293CCB|nr:macro domain-containing protein [Streptomyces sp. NBC_00190]
MALPPSDYTALLAELKEVRRAGLVRLRGRALPALEAAAQAATAPSARPSGAPIEVLLRCAVARLDAGTLRSAAEYTLGLAQGTRDWPASSRRARAASLYGVSVERFRKEQEVMVLGQVAEHIVRLAADADAADAGTAAVDGGGLGTHRTVEVRTAGRPVGLTVHVHPVDLLRDVDVIVSPSNVYFALPEAYKSSIAASLRRATAVHGVTGEVLADPLPAELHRWAERHGTSGRAVRPGTVAATGAGALTAQGIRRIYHAAIAVPRAGTNDYDVLPADVTRAVSRALALLAEEHHRHSPPLRSVCFPLLGSGRGGLPYQVSLAAVWAAVEAELARGARWDIHFVVRTPEAAAVVERVAAGIRPAHNRRPTG